jgi:hypothetical protein
MRDTWCRPVMTDSGIRVSGGAARNVRIKASGGMDRIIDTVAREAAQNALARAELAVRNTRMQPPAPSSGRGLPPRPPYPN